MWEEEGEVKSRTFMKYIDKQVIFVNFEKQNMNEGPYPVLPPRKINLPTRHGLFWEFEAHDFRRLIRSFCRL